MIALFLLISFAIVVSLRQKVFERKIDYNTRLSDATGLSTQTQLLFKGFEIGRVKSFSLNDDGWISVQLKIYQKYKSLFHTGSVINRLTSPITNKTQLEFIQNNKNNHLIAENSLIISTDLPEGLKIYKELNTGKSSDMVTSIMANLDRLVQELGKDNNADKGSLFRFMYHLANVTTEAESSIKEVNQLLKEAGSFTSNLNKDNNADKGAVFRILYNAAETSDKVEAEMSQVDMLLKTLNKAAKEYESPDSLIIRMIDPTGENLLNPVKDLIKSLGLNLSETQELLKYLNRQKPEMTTMLNQINSSMEKARKTLDALNNNPLIKSGIPKAGVPATGTGNRVKELPGE
jgi:phospholipid/cholesterol/gamma-HCH transport system substrate-binding protein